MTQRSPEAAGYAAASKEKIIQACLELAEGPREWRSKVINEIKERSARVEEQCRKGTLISIPALWLTPEDIRQVYPAALGRLGISDEEINAIIGK